MSFKIAIFAAAIFACQANAQLGIVRPFAAGFTNGLADMAKPFVQLGQTMMAPVADYLSGDHRPHHQAAQWGAQAQQMLPQAQSAFYEGYEALTSGMPGYGQMYRPRPNMAYKPQPQPQQQYYQIPPQANIPRPRPYPMPVPAPAPAPAPAPQSPLSFEEAEEAYVPSSLLIKPEEVPASIPEPSDVAFEENIKIPSLQRPLPVSEDKE